MLRKKTQRALLKGKTEQYIKWYFQELKERGYVHEIDDSPSSIVISEEAKITDWVTLKQRVYTPDLLIVWTNEGQAKWCNTMFSKDEMRKPFVCYVDTTLVEVKPDVPYNLAKANTSMVAFPLRQVMLYNMTSMYVQMLKVKDLFAATFTPRRYLFTDKTKANRTIHFHTRTLDEYLTLTNDLTKPLPSSKWKRGEETADDLGFEFVDDIGED